jgi:hypothetical protein
MRSCGRGDSHFELGIGFVIFLYPIPFDRFLGELVRGMAVPEK